MSKNKKIVSFIIGVIVLVGVFYGGMAYGKSQIKTAGVNAQNRNAQFGQFGMNRGGRGGAGSTAGFIAGEIISKDTNSITVKLVNGDTTSATNGTGSKIIFFDPSTTISKTAAGSLADLTAGTQISVTGTPNVDGSVSAKSIQIRPLPIRPNTTQTQ